MPRMRLNPAWQHQMSQELAAVAGNNRIKPVEHTTGEITVVRWLICMADELQVPYKIIQLGAGVRKFTTDTTVCSKCHGTGKC